MEAAKLNNLDVFSYLTYLLTELPKLSEFPLQPNLTAFCRGHQHFQSTANKCILLQYTRGFFNALLLTAYEQ
ncbi:MAG: transposase domain-containing protein [Clostridiales bacterium]|nr:transposase domain-containing protein [Clostridiales bacterium]